MLRAVCVRSMVLGLIKDALEQHGPALSTLEFRDENGRIDVTNKRARFLALIDKLFASVRSELNAGSQTNRPALLEALERFHDFERLMDQLQVLNAMTFVDSIRSLPGVFPVAHQAYFNGLSISLTAEHTLQEYNRLGQPDAHWDDNHYFRFTTLVPELQELIIMHYADGAHDCHLLMLYFTSKSMRGLLASALGLSIFPEPKGGLSRTANGKMPLFLFLMRNKERPKTFAYWYADPKLPMELFYVLGHRDWMSEALKNCKGMPSTGLVKCKTFPSPQNKAMYQSAFKLVKKYNMYDAFMLPRFNELQDDQLINLHQWLYTYLPLIQKNKSTIAWLLSNGDKLRFTNTATFMKTLSKFEYRTNGANGGGIYLNSHKYQHILYDVKPTFWLQTAVEMLRHRYTTYDGFNKIDGNKLEDKLKASKAPNIWLKTIMTQAMKHNLMSIQMQQAHTSPMKFLANALRARSEFPQVSNKPVEEVKSSRKRKAK